MGEVKIPPLMGRCRPMLPRHRARGLGRALSSPRRHRDEPRREEPGRLAGRRGIPGCRSGPVLLEHGLRCLRTIMRDLGARRGGPSTTSSRSHLARPTR